MSPDLFQNILVPMDGSDLSQAAFDKALMLSQALDATLLLTHVHKMADDGSANNGTDQNFHEQLAPAWVGDVGSCELVLQQKLKEASEAGVKAECIQTHGISGAAICYMALKRNVDLIVVGSSRRQGLSTLLTGSTSSYINRHAHCPVMMVYSATTSSTPDWQQRENLISA